MAVEITVSNAKLNEEVDFEKTDGQGTEGEYEFELLTDNAILVVDYSGGDEGAADITIPAGGDVAWQKANEEYVPLEFTVAHGEAKMVRIESAKYKDDDGNVTVEVGGDIAGNEDELEFAVANLDFGGVERA